MDPLVLDQWDKEEGTKDTVRYKRGAALCCPNSAKIPADQIPALARPGHGAQPELSGPVSHITNSTGRDRVSLSCENFKDFKYFPLLH